MDCHNYWSWKPEGEETDDYLVLCSDGLYSLVTDAEISESIATMSPQDACVHLVELSKSRGGFDNITLAILPIGGQLKEEEPPASMRTPVKRPKVVNQQEEIHALSNLSFSKRLVLVFFLFLIGCLTTALLMMFTLL